MNKEPAASAIFPITGQLNTSEVEMNLQCIIDSITWISIHEMWFDTMQNPLLIDRFSGFTNFIETPNVFNTFLDQFCTYLFLQFKDLNRNTNLLTMAASNINKMISKLKISTLRNCFINPIFRLNNLTLTSALPLSDCHYPIR